VTKAHLKVPISQALIATLLLCCQSARADLTSAPLYKTNWVQPKQDRIFTSSDDKLNAKLIVNRNIFDEGSAQTSGKLTILRNGKRAGGDRYTSLKGKADIVNISGPAIAAIGDQDENAVEIHKQCYQEIYNYEYAYNDKTHHYERRDPSIDLGDIGTQNNHPTWGNSFSTVGNTRASLHWKQDLFNFGGEGFVLTIKKGHRTLYSEPVEPPELESSDKRKDKTPECFGPFVTTQIDRHGKVMTDLRVTRVVGNSRLGCEMLYYWDRAAGKMKISTHEWGLNSPRLADLRGNNKIEYLTEDWSLSQPDMGGPIQIWQWGKGNKLVNVTTQFPREIENHAQAAYAEWNKDHTRASLLAHVGDICLLHQPERALKALHKMSSATETNDAVIAQLKREHYLP
jgi:hypothetical protein